MRGRSPPGGFRSDTAAPYRHANARRSGFTWLAWRARPWYRSHGAVADRFDVIAVRVANERAVVGRVVLGPHLRLVERLSPGRGRGVRECPDRGTVRRDESDGGLAKPVPGGLLADPQVRPARRTVDDRDTRVPDPATAH